MQSYTKSQRFTDARALSRQANIPLGSALTLVTGGTYQKRNLADWEESTDPRNGEESDADVHGYHEAGNFR